MKMLMRLMLSLYLAIPQATYAGFGGLDDESEEFSPAIFCEEIKKNLLNNSPVEKTCGRFVLFKQATAITGSCEQLVAEYQKDKNAITKVCEGLGIELKEAIDQAQKGEAILFQNMNYGISKSVTKGTLNETDKFVEEKVSIAMLTCQEQLRQDCSQEHIQLDFYKFAERFPQDDFFALSYTDVDYDQKTCECFERAREVSSNLYGRDLKKEDDEGRKKVLDLVEDSIAKKLINEFSHNLERAHYYKANEKTALSVLGDDPQFNCTNIEDYSKDIRNACHGSGLSEQDISSKISRFLDSFENNKTSAPIQAKLQQLQDKILNTGKSKDGKLMDRKKYDQYRYSNAQTGIEGVFIEELLRKVYSSSSLKNDFQKIAQDKVPARALAELMTNFSNKEMRQFFEEFSKKKDLPENFRNDLVTAFSSSASLEKFKNDTIEIAIDMNPSLKTALGNYDLFQTVMSNLTPKNKLNDALEKSASKLKNYYLKSCDDYRQKFAEAICTPKEKYLGKMNRDDMRKLLQDNLSQIPQAHIIDKTMCSLTNESKKGDSVFGRVAQSHRDRFIESDYVARMKNPNDKTADRYSYLSEEMNKGNESVKNLVEKTIDRFTPSNSISPSIGGLEKVSEASSHSLPTPNLQKVQESIAAPTLPPTFQNFAAPPTVERSMAGQHEGKEKASPQSEVNFHDLFRNLFAEESQKRKVDTHLKNINETDMQELQRLREQIAKGKVELNELTSLREREKIKSLEDKVKFLENEKKSAEARVEMGTRREMAQEKSFGATPQFQAGGFIPNKENSFPTPGNTGGTASQLGSAQTHGASAAMSAARVPASEGKTAETGYTVRESSGDLIITSSKVLSNNLKTEDLSAEVIDFVKKQKPDLRTLKQLMSKGLILKLKVVKDGAEVQKEFKVDSQKLTEQAKNYLRSQIALQEYQEAKRQHSFASLKYLLGIKSQSTVN